MIISGSNVFFGRMFVRWTAIEPDGNMLERMRLHESTSVGRESGFSAQRSALAFAMPDYCRSASRGIAVDSDDIGKTTPHGKRRPLRNIHAPGGNLATHQFSSWGSFFGALTGILSTLRPSIRRRCRNVDRFSPSNSQALPWFPCVCSRTFVNSNRSTAAITLS